jgi:hypothetical protein
MGCDIQYGSHDRRQSDTKIDHDGVSKSSSTTWVINRFATFGPTSGVGRPTVVVHPDRT